MSLTADAVNQALERLAEALLEVRGATTDAHAAKKDLHQEIKKHRDDIRRAIEDEVHRQVKAVTETVVAQLATRMENLIEEIADDWRDKLGLPR